MKKLVDEESTDTFKKLKLFLQINKKCSLRSTIDSHKMLYSNLHLITMFDPVTSDFASVGGALKI